MRRSLQVKLSEDFPILYRKMGEPEFCGIGCGSGWWNLIHSISAKLEKLVSVIKDPPYISQVKEMFGVLKIEMHGEPTEEMQEIVGEAQEKSSHICEHCGSAAEIRDMAKVLEELSVDHSPYTGILSWIKTVCDACFKKQLITKKMVQSRLDLLIKFNLPCSQEEWDDA